MATPGRGPNRPVAVDISVGIKPRLADQVRAERAVVVQITLAARQHAEFEYVGFRARQMDDVIAQQWDTGAIEFDQQPAEQLITLRVIHLRDTQRHAVVRVADQTQPEVERLQPRVGRAEFAHRFGADQRQQSRIWPARRDVRIQMDRHPADVIAGPHRPAPLLKRLEAHARVRLAKRIT